MSSNFSIVTFILKFLIAKYIFLSLSDNIILNKQILTYHSTISEDKFSILVQSIVDRLFTEIVF